MCGHSCEASFVIFYGWARTLKITVNIKNMQYFAISLFVKYVRVGVGCVWRWLFVTVCWKIPDSNDPHVRFRFVFFEKMATRASLLWRNNIAFSKSSAQISLKFFNDTMPAVRKFQFNFENATAQIFYFRGNSKMHFTQQRVT